MCIILSNFKRGQTPILISHTMKHALSSFVFLIVAPCDLVHGSETLFHLL